MDSKIALINLAHDLHRDDANQIFQEFNTCTSCIKCRKTFYFLSKDDTYCNKCFLTHKCSVDFTPDNFSISLKLTNKNILTQPLSLIINNDTSNGELNRVRVNNQTDNSNVSTNMTTISKLLNSI